MQNYSWNPVLISLFFLNWYIDTYLGFFWICNRRSYSVPNSPLCWSSQIGLAQIVRAFLRNKFRLNLYWLWSAFQWWSYLFYSLLLLPFLSLSDNHGPPQLLMFLFILFFPLCGAVEEMHVKAQLTPENSCWSHREVWLVELICCNGFPGLQCRWRSVPGMSTTDPWSVVSSHRVASCCWRVLQIGWYVWKCQ